MTPKYMALPLGFCAILLSVCLALGHSNVGRSEEFTVEKVPEGVAVKVDGQLFTKYWLKAGSKPVLWPVRGPGGASVTRDFPMQDQPGEDQDHLHQRSLWLSHGNVNGIDFWSELPGHGTIEHRGFVTLEGGRRAVIASRNDWLGPDGQKQCEDERRLTFEANRNSRWIDFDVTMRAAGRPVIFGDTKEGAFGLRVAAGLTAESRAKIKLGGHIVNSHGDRDTAVWGKRADWVDYYGLLDKKPAGVAIFNHPASFRYPTFWHVRPYGLFAANPFGVHDFTGGASGAKRLDPGQSLRLLYRVFIHEGDEKAGRVAENYAAYLKAVKKK